MAAAASMIPLFTIPPGCRSRTTPLCRLHYRGDVSFKVMKEPAHLALHCRSWRAALARSGHAEHRQSRAVRCIAGAAPAVPGRLVAERGGGRMRALDQTGREVGRGRSDERRVGNECVRTWRYRGSPYHYTK